MLTIIENIRNACIFICNMHDAYDSSYTVCNPMDGVAS